MSYVIECHFLLTRFQFDYRDFCLSGFDPVSVDVDNRGSTVTIMTMVLFMVILAEHYFMV